MEFLLNIEFISFGIYPVFIIIRKKENYPSNCSIFFTFPTVPPVLLISNHILRSSSALFLPITSDPIVNIWQSLERIDLWVEYMSWQQAALIPLNLLAAIAMPRPEPQTRMARSNSPEETLAAAFSA